MNIEDRHRTSNGLGGMLTYVGLLDLNGDGINDHFHARRGSSGAVWFGLGDGTYLLLDDAIPPGITWNMKLMDSSGPQQWYREVWAYGTPGEPGSHSYKRSDVIDMNGDGLLDQVIYWPQCSECTSYGVIFHPGPSGLLTKVTNELGGVTEFKYEPSNWTHYKAETSSGGPDPETHLPDSGVVRSASPQWVVTEVTVDDGRTDTLQEQLIEYAGLRYDYKRREYLGARMAETIDDPWAIDNPDGADVLTRRFFHQTEKLRPRLQFEEIENADEVVVRTEKTTWTAVPAVAELETPMDDAWFPQPTQTVTQLIDPIISTNTQTRTVDRDFEAATGNLTKRTDWGPDEALGGADDYVENFVYYAVPSVTEDWLVSYPRSWYETLGGDMGKSEFFGYDGRASSQPPTQGLLTFRWTYRGPGLPSVAVYWDYDAFGNQTHYWDAVPNEPVPTRLTTYDSEFETFPDSITNRLGHVTQYKFKTDFGEVEKVLDPNGYLRCWAYDDFGRLEVRKDRATDGASITSPCTRTLATFDYSEDMTEIGDPENQRILATEYPGSPASGIRSRQFFDGLGRVYQEELEQKEGTFVTTVRGWGPRGELTCESLPFTGSGGVPDPDKCEDVASLIKPVLLTSYDALLRPLDTSRDSGGTPQREISRTYSISDLDGLSGDELVERRTVYVDETPSVGDRVVNTGTDPLGRVVAIDESESGGGLTILERDAKGRIVTVNGPNITDLDGGGTDPNDLSITYNNVDQRMSLSGLWPGGTGRWSYSYDLNGNLSEQTSPEGTTIGFHCDPLNRTSSVYPVLIPT